VPFDESLGEAAHPGVTARPRRPQTARALPSLDAQRADKPVHDRDPRT